MATQTLCSGESVRRLISAMCLNPYPNTDGVLEGPIHLSKNDQKQKVKLTGRPVVPPHALPFCPLAHRRPQSLRPLSAYITVNIRILSPYGCLTAKEICSSYRPVSGLIPPPSSSGIVLLSPTPPEPMVTEPPGNREAADASTPDSAAVRSH